MSLKTSDLETAIAAALKAEQKTEDATTAANAIAKALASAIESFVKSGEVNFISGDVKGVAPSGGGPITAGLATGGKIS